MRLLLAAALILAALLLLGQIRFGTQVLYSSAGVKLKLKIGPVKITLLPQKEKKRPEKKPKKPKKPKKAAEGPPLGPEEIIALVKQALPVALEAAGRLKRKIRVDRLYLDVAVGGEDPAAAATAYGGLNAAIGMIWPLVEQNLHVKDRRIRTRADFLETRTRVDLDAAATLTVGQAVALAFWLAPKLPRILRTIMKKDKTNAEIQTKEAV